MLQHLYQHGLKETYCDYSGTLWSSGLGGWATIFYISKYYEFLDTFVLIVKNKKPSFLQIYHHAGVAICMWGAVASQGAWVLVVVLLNSGIHTLMYFYFLVKTIWPEVQIKQAKYLTAAQIAQFFTGIGYVVPVYFMGDECNSSASKLAALVCQMYAIGLILLFLAFSRKKYNKKVD